MSRKLKIKTMTGVLLFFLISMSAMLVHARNKTIIVTEVAQDQFGEETVSQQVSDKKAGNLLYTREEGNENHYLRIPLEAGMKAEDVKIENHYVDRELWVYIEDGSEEFYEQIPVSGNLDGLEAGSYEVGKGYLLLKFALQKNYECHNELEEASLYIEFLSPREIYDKIVVIDPACGGDDKGFSMYGLVEKDVTLDIVKRVKAKLDGENIKVYYTRMEDKNPTQEERIELANGVGADIFICVALNFDHENPKQYGTEAIFNDSFFIPEFGSVELADLTEREVVTSISGRGNGLTVATKEDIVVWDAQVPATILKVGYLSNEQEAALLAREDYRERIANGLYQVILKAYE